MRLTLCSNITFQYWFLSWINWDFSWKDIAFLFLYEIWKCDLCPSCKRLFIIVENEKTELYFGEFHLRITCEWPWPYKPITSFSKERFSFLFQATNKQEVLEWTNDFYKLIDLKSRFLSFAFVFYFYWSTIQSEENIIKN